MSRRSARSRRMLATLLAIALLSAFTALPAAVAVPTPPTARPDGIGASTEMTAAVHPLAAADDQWGSALAVSGRRAVIGTLFADVDGYYEAGRATAYVWSPSAGWQYDSDLPVNNEATMRYAGASVAVSEDEAFSGCLNGSVPGQMYGLVWVYENVGGVYSIDQTLTVPEGDGGSGFGRSMALDGDTLVVSADAMVGTATPGAVFVFTKGAMGWSYSQRLDSPAPEDGQYFGHALAIQGDDLVVGSPYWGPNEQGRVYTYRRSAGGIWVHQGEQSLDAAGPDDRFGWSVAVSNGIMAAGAPGRETSVGPGAGAAYVSRWAGSGWAQIADLENPATTPTPTAHSKFGESVTLSSDTLLISCPLTPEPGNHFTCGAVYRYTVDPLRMLPPTYRETINDSTPTPGDDLGEVLAFDGDTLLAGVPTHATPTTSTCGMVCFFGGVRTARCRVDQTLTVPTPGLLGNDTTVDGTMTASCVTTPAHGVATVAEDGSWSYEPASVSDPTRWFVGTDSFEYQIADQSGVATSVVTVEVDPPATKVATAISLKRSASSVRRYRKLKLYGRLNPGALGDHCVVYVKKPGSHSWRKLSTRHASSITPNAGANWSYSMKPKSRGRYYFKVRFPGDAYRYSDWSPSLSVRVR